jgi:phytanoyl-CoA hydroxylase
MASDGPGAPHPWNTAFEWQDHAGPFTFLEPAQVRRYDEAGFFVVDDLLPPDVVADAAAEIDRFEAETEAFLRDCDGEQLMIAEAGAITFTVHLVARSPGLRDLTRHPRLVGVARDLLGPDVRLYWDQAVYKKPEKPRRFPWHQDNGYAYVEPLGYQCFTDPPGVVAAPVRAGGAVVFSSLTPHLTGPNLTGGARKAYIVQYAPAGAHRLEGDPASGPPTGSVACDDPGRQFPVLERDAAL